MESKTYIKKLNEVMNEIEKQDNLSVAQILKMNMYDYKKQLVERAGKILKEREENTKYNLLDFNENIVMKNVTMEIIEIFLKDKEKSLFIIEPIL